MRNSPLLHLQKLLQRLEYSLQWQGFSPPFQEEKGLPLPKNDVPPPAPQSSLAVAQSLENPSPSPHAFPPLLVLHKEPSSEQTAFPSSSDQAPSPKQPKHLVVLTPFQDTWKEFFLPVHALPPISSVGVPTGEQQSPEARLVIRYYQQEYVLAPIYESLLGRWLQFTGAQQRTQVHLFHQVASFHQFSKSLPQIDAIFLLGQEIAQDLLQTHADLRALRGQTISYGPYPTIVTYHPQEFLENPALRLEIVQDLKRLKGLLFYE